MPTKNKKKFRVRIKVRPPWLCLRVSFVKTNLITVISSLISQKVWDVLSISSLFYFKFLLIINVI